MDHQSRENGRRWQSCPVWLPTTNWTLETFLSSMAVTRLHCLLLRLSEYLVLCFSSPLKLLERHTLTSLFSIMPATNYRLVFFIIISERHHFLMMLEVDMHAFFVIFVCMYVCMCKIHASFFFCHHSCD